MIDKGLFIIYVPLNATTAVSGSTGNKRQMRRWRHTLNREGKRQKTWWDRNLWLWLWFFVVQGEKGINIGGKNRVCQCGTIAFACRLRDHSTLLPSSLHRYPKVLLEETIAQSSFVFTLRVCATCFWLSGRANTKLDAKGRYTASAY